MPGAETAVPADDSRCACERGTGSWGAGNGTAAERAADLCHPAASDQPSARGRSRRRGRSRSRARGRAPAHARRPQPAKDPHPAAGGAGRASGNACQEGAKPRRLAAPLLQLAAQVVSVIVKHEPWPGSPSTLNCAAHPYDEFVDDCESGRAVLPVVVPALGDTRRRLVPLRRAGLEGWGLVAAITLYWRLASFGPPFALLKTSSS